ncbi:MAG: DUF1080 domain-containing protein [Dysgonamonadaceae bacterium]|jgi:hypothetical protein|nr:DUF1080 domain-containing protein [Dysgonamonadaceae bacterium]
MRKTTFLLLTSLIACLGISCPQKTNSDSQSEWIQLFNGKNLDGWTPKIRGYALGENFGNTFRVEDGLLKVRYDQYDTFDKRYGHLFYKDSLSHYIIRVEYRFVGDQCNGGEGWAYRNSGIMLHGQTPQSMDKDQDFPASIEVQLLGSDSTTERSNGNVCTPGTNIVIGGKLITDHCIGSSSKPSWGDDWVTAEVEVRGNEVIKHIVNGDTVMVYNQPQLDDREASYPKLFALNGNDKMLHGGSISLQSESHPCDFRKVELKILEE